MRRLILALVTACAVGFTGQAAQAIPAEVMTAYRAYMAAIEVDDLQSASGHAEAAYQAGRDAGIDGATLAALAENRAQVYTDLGDRARAAPAWRELAVVMESAGVEADERGRALVSAATQYFLLPDLGQALSAADEAITLYPADAAANDLFFAHRVRANVLWQRGRLRQSGEAAREALAVRERIGPIADRTTMMTATFAAVAAALRNQPEEVAFYVALAALISEAIPASSDDRMMLDAWDGFARFSLSEEQKEALFERTLASALFDLDVPDAGADEAMADEEDDREIVDAVPLRRVEPTYPPRMLESGVEGFSLVMFDVSPEGQPQNIRTLLSVPHRDFGVAGERTVRRWRYQPRTVDGVPETREGVVTHFLYRMVD